jgi:hypothetical protein
LVDDAGRKGGQSISIEIRHIGSFKATDDPGRSCTLHTYTRFEHTGVHLIEGLKTIRTADGGHVNRLDKDKYQLLGAAGCDIILHTDDPDAP